QQSISAEQVAKFLGKVQSSFLDLWKMYAPSPAANVNPVNPLASVSKKVDQDTTNICNSAQKENVKLGWAKHIPNFTENGLK
ncbi:hypothetical protein PCASD_26062, partial [Puccinia coronata f. sp. avenae]